MVVGTELERAQVTLYRATCNAGYMFSLRLPSKLRAVTPNVDGGSDGFWEGSSPLRPGWLRPRFLSTCSCAVFLVLANGSVLPIWRTDAELGASRPRVGQDAGTV